MSRELSGRIADTVVASEFFGSFPDWSEALVTAPELVEGETVGNSPDGSVGEVSVPPPSVLKGSGGSDSAGMVLLGTLGEADATISIVAAAWKEVALVPFAVAVSVIRFPAAAAAPTWTPATSSSLWPVGRVPTVQTAPLRCEHTLNRGAATWATAPMLAVTVTPLAAAAVLQTQIA